MDKTPNPTIGGYLASNSRTGQYASVDPTLPNHPKQKGLAT